MIILRTNLPLKSAEPSKVRIGNGSRFVDRASGEAAKRHIR
jgi:hypothetical protein